MVLRDFKGEEKGVVVDGLVRDSVSEATHNYLGAFGNWEHRYWEEKTIYGKGGGKNLEEVEKRSGVRFRQRLSLSWVRSSPIGKALQEAVRIGSGEEGVWDVVDAEAHHLRRGDVTFVHRACNEFGEDPLQMEKESTEDWYGIFVMVSTKNADEYAELVLFDWANLGGKEQLDSFGGIRLIPGRIVAIPCTSFIRRSPPSVETGKGHLSIVARLRKRPDPSTPIPYTMEEEEGDEDEEVDDVGRGGVDESGGSDGKDALVPRYWGSDFPQGLLSSEQRLHDWGLQWAVGDDLQQIRKEALARRTRMYASFLGRTVHVFDGLFPDPTPLRLLREHIQQKASYNFDDSSDPDSDNVQWIVGLDEKEFMQTAVSKVVSAVVNSVTPWNGFYPYDVSVNIIRSWDNTKMHTDCGDGELEYTALLYLNEDIGVHDGAETMFFDDIGPLELAARKRESDARGEKSRGGTGYGSGPPDAEVIAVVRPVFGRMAVFNGNIPHSARPPAPSYRGIRFTFAIKHSSSSVAAKAKTLHQALHSVQDEVDRDVDDKGTESAWKSRKKQLARFEEQVAKIKRQSTANDAPSLLSISSLLTEDVFPSVTAGFTFQDIPPGDSLTPRPQYNSSTAPPPPSPPSAVLDSRAEPALEKARSRMEQWVLELETETLRSLYESMQLDPEASNSLLQRREEHLKRSKKELET